MGGLNWPGALIPPRCVLTGTRVRLVPLQANRDAERLYAISHDTPSERALWRYLLVGPFPDVAAYGTYLDSWATTPNVVAYVIENAADHSALGTISLMAIRPEHGVAELGNIWLTPSAQGHGFNTEACRLLLQHCFEDWGYRRVEWKCDATNGPSRHAATRLGFREEGTFRQHMVVKGENRDTTWHAILDTEWRQQLHATETKHG
jgi:RimJ/RimL family protein N-acetyltransferase